MKRIAVIFLVMLFMSVSSIVTGLEVDGKLHRVLEMVPGGTFEGEISIRNTTDLKEEIKISQSDYFYSAEGKVRFGRSGSDPRSNAEWIKVEPDRLVLEPGSKATVRYRVAVPSGQSLSGSYWSLINFDHRIVEETLTQEERSQENDRTSATVKPLFGYSFQIITNIGRNSSMELDLRNPELFKTPESFYFQVDLHCTGEMMVNVAPWVELYDSGGKKVKSANGKKSTILPGCSSRQAFEVGRIKNGNYKLLLIVDTGTDKVFGGQYELNVR